MAWTLEGGPLLSPITGQSGSTCERGFYAFNDLHAMMAFAMAGRAPEAVHLVDNLQWTVKHGRGTNVAMTREVGLPVCQAIRRSARVSTPTAIDRLQAARDGAHRFGGSHAQRDVLTLTLIEAALRSGQPGIARHYIAERTVHKPASRWGWRLLARTNPR